MRRWKRGLFPAQLPGGGGPLCLCGDAEALVPGVSVVSGGAGLSGEKCLYLAQCVHPVGNVDSGACAVSSFCLSFVAEPGEAQEYVYPLCLCLFHFKLLPVLAVERRAVSRLRSALFLVRGGGAGGAARADKVADGGNGAFADGVLLPLSLLGTGHVKKERFSHGETLFLP